MLENNRVSRLQIHNINICIGRTKFMNVFFSFGVDRFILLAIAYYNIRAFVYWNHKSDNFKLHKLEKYFRPRDSMTERIR